MVEKNSGHYVFFHLYKFSKNKPTWVLNQK